MAKNFQRPAEDFTCESVQWDIDIVKRHTDAGFDDIPRDEIVLHFWILLDFLQSHKLTKRTVAASPRDMTNETKLTNFDLTDDGYYFLQKYLGRHSGRLYKRDSQEKSQRFLIKWFDDFRTKRMEKSN